MARKRMVTRTITFTTAKVSVYDIETDEIKIVEYKLCGEPSADVVLKTIAKEHKDVRPFKVIEVAVKEALYGMSEEKFIELAKIIPSRTKFSE